MPNRDPLTTSVIACHWRRTADGWRLWVKGREDLCGQAPTYEAAHDALTAAIMAAARDLDAVLPVYPEFDPPLPAPPFAEQYLSPELYLLSPGDEFFELNRPSHATAESADSRAAYLPTIFSDGVCKACNRARGDRTEVTLRVDNAPHRVDVGHLRAPFDNPIRLFSDRFLDLLTPREREYFRPIQMPPRSRRRFHELRGRPSVPFVGARGLESDGTECTACGRRSVYVNHPWLMEGGLCITRFVCANDLPASLDACFTVGEGNDVHLCVTRERWDALRGRTGVRGITTQRLGVVAAADCDRHPRIRNSLLPCELCDEWPAPRAVSNEKQAVFDLPAHDCSSRNFAWFADAQRWGYIQFSQSTMQPMELLALAKRTKRPPRTEYASFRCLKCWRLGYIVLSAGESALVLHW
ncbi:MAG: hypothetical protein SF069_16760 [Phycisphaerae bacterium]|nr:hypothetical protein [Phycisphaerae bacterium]